MFDVKLTTSNHQTACGPACLRMLLDFYGIEVPLQELIEECGGTVNGTSATDLLRVGRAHGLDAISAWQEHPADILRQDRPAIIWWKFNHFVVFAGLNEAKEPVIANPMRGMYAISAESFSALASGLQPGTCVALCVGRPVDFAPVAPANYAQDALFELGGEPCVALRPITRGETLRQGWNYNTVSIIDALNAQKEN